MRRLLAIVVALAALGAAPAAANTTKSHHTTRARTVKVCHWVKATKKHKRHKVCFRHKVTSSTATAKKKKRPVAAVPAKPPATAAPALGSLTPGAPAATPAPAPPTASASPVAGAPAPVTPSAPAAPPARLQVTAREWSLTLSRGSVPAGNVIAELVNRGEDGHDLHVRPAAGGPDVLALPETASGGVFDSDSTALAAGTYTVYCSLPGHEAAGMHATLTVR